MINMAYYKTNMSLLFYQAVFIYMLLPFCQAASSIQYDAILALVVLELVFAFGVGLSCILFSINLIRAINDPSLSHVPSGTFPKSRSSSCGNTLQGDLMDGDDGQIVAPDYTNVGNYDSRISIQQLDHPPTYDTFYPIYSDNIVSGSPSEDSATASAQSARPSSVQLSPPKSFLSAFFDYMW